MGTNKEGYMKEYYSKNKDKFKAYPKKPHKQQKCEICDCIIKSGKMWKHITTLKHEKNEMLRDYKNKLEKL
jgi:hypothetical protein